MTISRLPSYSSHCGSLLISVVVEDIFWQVLVFSIDGYFANSCDFGMPERECEIRVFLLTILVDLPPQSF